MLLHHLLGLLISVVTLLAPPYLLRYAPHLWVCESSNIGLGVSWAARKLGAPRVQQWGEGAFVLCYTFTRVLSLPVVVFTITVARWGESTRAGTRLPVPSRARPGTRESRFLHCQFQMSVLLPASLVV